MRIAGCRQPLSHLAFQQHVQSDPKDLLMQPALPVSSDEPPMTAETQPFRLSGVSEITATSLLK